MQSMNNFVATFPVTQQLLPRASYRVGISSLPRPMKKGIISSPKQPSKPRLVPREATTSPRHFMADGDGFHPFNGHISRHLHDRDLDDMKPEDPYLSYHDVLLTKEDIDTLKDDWLTDNVISFYEEFLEHETLSNHKDAHVVLLRPSMTLMLFVTKDPLSLKEVLPSFDQVSHIFLPINDNTDPSRAEGGSHWSLLVVSTFDKAAFHYDSLHSANEREAKIVSMKMSQLLGYELEFKDLTDAPQQSNSSDCGVFVCMVMNALLCNRLLQTQKGARVSMSMKGKRMNASQGRKDILRLIQDRRREGERRRSTSGSPQVKSGSRSPPRIE